MYGWNVSLSPYVLGIFTLPRVLFPHSSNDRIHRFFDSLPISSNNRYLAITETPLPPFDQLPYANITIYDFKDHSQRVIDQSLAWAGQLGAQTQFASSSPHLVYYNTLIFNPTRCSSFHAFQQSLPCHASITLNGTLYNLHTRHKHLLQCPLYHVAPNGLYSISPNLFNIQHTQRGYGVDWLPSKAGIKTPHFRLPFTLTH